MLISCAVNVGSVLTGTDRGQLFAEWGNRQVLSVLVPTIVYVALVPYSIYVASALLIAFFMRVLGRYGWIVTAAVSVAVPILTFLMFESWFWCRCRRGRRKHVGILEYRASVGRRDGTGNKNSIQRRDESEHR